MNDAEALHTAARRYCRDRYGMIWSNPAYTKDQHFWGAHRIRLLAAILIDVESVLPADFASPTTMREYLLLAGQTGDDLYCHACVPVSPAHTGPSPG